MTLEELVLSQLIKEMSKNILERKMGKYLIGMDAGTTGCKVCVFDLNGNLIGSNYREYPCYYPNPGWVEQIPEDMFPALCETCRVAIEKSGVDPKDILGVGLSSQGSVIGLLDKDEKLIRPFVGWQDLRGSKNELDWYTSQISKEEHYKITGDPLGFVFSVLKMIWLKNNEPENWEKTELFSTHQDYFLRRLGADGYYTDFSSASREGMMDINQNVWSERIHKVVGIPLEKRAKIISEPGKVVGKIGPEVAKLTGLAEGTPICMGAHDQNCNTFGCGGVDDGTAIMVMGTFGSCFVISDKNIRDPKGKLVVKGNHGVGNYTIEAFSNTSASSYRWYRDTFCDLEKYAGATNGVDMDPYDIINGQIEKVPIGANGVTFLPYLQGAAGEKINDRARGTFIGMNLGTQKADIARSVMEGISFEMLDIIDAERAAGIDLKNIRLTGGAAKSPLWAQMLSDMTQLPIQILEASESGCLGAAMYAGVGVGAYNDVHDAAKKAVRIKEEYQPNNENADAYSEAHQRFINVYDALNNRVF